MIALVLNGPWFVLLIVAAVAGPSLWLLERERDQPDDLASAERWQRGEDALKRISDRANAARWERGDWG